MIRIIKAIVAAFALIATTSATGQKLPSSKVLCEAYLKEEQYEKNQYLVESALSLIDTANIDDLPSSQVRQMALRTFYGAHIKLLDSCSGYKLKVMPLVGFPVMDIEGVFDQIQLEEIEQKCKEFSEALKMPLVVATMPSAKPFSDFHELAKNSIGAWGFPHERKNPRLLVLISKQSRKVIVYGNDGALERISTKEMDHVIASGKANLAAGNYYGAVEQFLQCLTKFAQD
jgi:hypothetical protein